MKKIIAIAISVMFASSAIANDGLYVIGGGISRHYKDSNQNEIHPSIGFELDGVSVIYVEKNSVENKSLQLAYSDSFYKSNIVDIGYRVGIASGYKKGSRYDDGNRYYNGYEIGNTGLLPLAGLEFIFHTPVPKLDLVVDVLPNVSVLGFKYKL